MTTSLRHHDRISTSLTGAAAIDERLLDQALHWHCALAADDVDWDGHIVWLETDPRHRRTFDAVALLDGLIADHRQQVAAMLPDD